KIDGAPTGLFPAEASPTGSAAGPTKKQRGQPVGLTVPPVGPASAGKPLPLLLLLIFYARSPNDTKRDLGAG
ncbi:hypothetical protein, partial [Pseudomonas sp.]|uniref:hypothetical protein n=1 Tax=Pseudomonas sp. TaxID=306 RepID=UPI0025EB17A2